MQTSTGNKKSVYRETKMSTIIQKWKPSNQNNDGYLSKKETKETSPLIFVILVNKLNQCTVIGTPTYQLGIQFTWKCWQ